MSATFDASKDELRRQRPELDGVVALQAIWSAAAVISPTSEALVWAAVPLAVAFAAFAHRTGRRRVPTLANAVMNYINMGLVEVGFSHWVLGATEVLRDKIIILTVMGAGAAALEIRAWLDDIMTLRERVINPPRPTPVRHRPVKPRRRRRRPRRSPSPPPRSTATMKAQALPARRRMHKSR